MAEAVKNIYSEVYEHNEYAHELSDSDLKGIVIQITGHASDSRPANLIVKTFMNLANYADFTTEQEHEDVTTTKDDANGSASDSPSNNQLKLPPAPSKEGNRLGMNLSYTINLNLPASTDISVFNAIFKSLKENILKD